MINTVQCDRNYCDTDVPIRYYLHKLWAQATYHSCKCGILPKLQASGNEQITSESKLINISAHRRALISCMIKGMILKVIFNEIQFTLYNLSFLEYSSMRFDKCIQLCNHHHNTEQFHHPQKCPTCPFIIINTSPSCQSLTTTDLFSVPIV